MFVNFFYKLKEVGIPVSPTSFLTLHRAVNCDLVNSVEDLYIAARSILVKSEKFFDLYDQVFAHVFDGVELVDTDVDQAAIDLLARSMLDEWLKNPQTLAKSLGVDEKKLGEMSPEELLEYFKERLKDQEGRHDGGSKWIGTGGTSPVGHSGVHPGGLRVGGESTNQSAIKVAGERRYRDYSIRRGLTRSSMGEALKRLRNLVPQGARDNLNIDATIRETMRNGGEIELVFDRCVVDRLKVILAIDNGGWSMEPHVELVQTLFSYAKNQFKDVKTYFFHNTIYDLLWSDPARYRKPVMIKDFNRLDPDTRFIVVGDASMAPYELMATDGSIYAFERSGKPSVEQLRFLAGVFRRTIWLNPVPENQWPYTRSIQVIRNIFPMFELSLDGLEKGVSHLMGR
ncbi:MAG: vWA domain-containing protein [Desulforhopalus sp.]